MAAELTTGLSVANVEVRYGGVSALSGVSLQVAPGTVAGLIGPNGAGKTTLINAVTGIVRPTAGTIELAGLPLHRMRQHEIARAGVARTYQNIRLFGTLSVAQNVAAGAYSRAGALGPDAITALLARVGVENASLESRANSLSYGDQRRIEIARALAARPAIVLLDEPAAGMNPAETRALGATIRALASDGIGVLLVEHNMSLVKAVCDEVVVLNFGCTIARGSPAIVARDPAVVEAYLGVEEPA